MIGHDKQRISIQPSAAMQAGAIHYGQRRCCPSSGRCTPPLASEPHRFRGPLRPAKGQIVLRPLPFSGLPALANSTPEPSKHHNPHSAKPPRRFVQYGFNEVAESECVIPPWSPATSQNPPDSLEH